MKFTHPHVPRISERAELARTAVRARSIETGAEDEDIRTQLVDLLADLMHLCDAESLCLGDIERIARSHYLAELSEERHGHVVRLATRKGKKRS